MKTIIWDVDDVLKLTMRGWFEKFWLPNHLGCSIKKFEQITENPPHQLLQIEKIEYLKSLDEFRLSKIAEEIQPIPETLKWFEEHG